MAVFTADILIGYGLATVAVFSLASATACTQAVNGAIPITQILLGQFMIEVLLSLPVMAKEKTFPKVKREKWAALGAITLPKFLCHILFYLAPKLAPAGVVQAMRNTAGMITCIVRDAIKKRGCTVRMSVPLMLCFIGIILTAQPSFLGFSSVKQVTGYVSPCYQNRSSIVFQSNFSVKSTSAIDRDVETHSEDSVIHIPGTYDIPLGYTLSALSGASQGLSFIVSVEYLSEVNPNTVNFWIGSINTGLSSVGLAIQSPVLSHNVKCWTLATGSSLGDALASNLLNYAVLRIYATAVAILLTFNIVIVAVFQYTILRPLHRGHENWEEYLGLVILTVANVLYPILSWRENHLDEYSNLEEDLNTGHELK